eukprot:m.148801 g.148801  ORF g.148801 m.148801 type:complete len:314 (-) comp24403_c0_seq9:40-981(-)
MDQDFQLTIKWNGKQTQVDLSPSDTILDLKEALCACWGVLPHRQKLMGLSVKGKPAADDVSFSTIKVKTKAKIMMMGTLESDLESKLSRPEGEDNVVNDFDVDEIELQVADDPRNLAKIEKRVSSYQFDIKAAPRPGKKLLVLDIDYTLYDHRSNAETFEELRRPFLHEFLTHVYQWYDIAIWSATSMKWIETKMDEMGCAQHPNYRLVFYVDSRAMITVNSPKYGVIEVKPLGVIWGKFSSLYTSKNTIMFDDLRRNFLMNPKNGLKIRPCRKLALNRDSDNELQRLSVYLEKIKDEEDLSALDHKHWEKRL